MRSKLVTFIANHSANEIGGIQLANKNLLRALKDEGFEVAAVYRPKLEPRFLNTKVITKVLFGLRVIQCLLSKHSGLIIIGHINLIGLLPIMKLFNRSRPEVILVIHGIEAWGISGTSKRLISQNVSRLWAVSAYTANKIRFHIPPSISVDIIYNACSYDYYPRQLRPNIRNRYELIFIGRLSSTERYKGLDELLAMLSTSRDLFPGVHLTVIGSGSDRGRLESKAHALNIGDLVTFMGTVTEEEKILRISASHLLVLCGYGEGFGIAMLEAASLGTPVLGSLLDATSEVIDIAKIGFVANPESPESLRNELLKARQVLESDFDLSGIKEFSYNSLRKRVSDAMRGMN